MKPWNKVVEAATVIGDKGYCKFSISGETATTASPEEAGQFPIAILLHGQLPLGMPIR